MKTSSSTRAKRQPQADAPNACGPRALPDLRMSCCIRRTLPCRVAALIVVDRSGCAQRKSFHPAAYASPQRHAATTCSADMQPAARRVVEAQRDRPWLRRLRRHDARHHRYQSQTRNCRCRRPRRLRCEQSFVQNVYARDDDGECEATAAHRMLDRTSDAD